MSYVVVCPEMPEGLDIMLFVDRVSAEEWIDKRIEELETQELTYFIREE